MPVVNQPPSRPRARPNLTAFWRDRRGASAVEFAFIAPVLLLFYCGMAELTEAMLAQRRLILVASSIGDIVARDTQLTDARRTDVFKVGGVLIAPFPSTSLRMCLVSVLSDTKGKDTVDWSEPYNAPVNCPTKGTVLTDIPDSVLPANQSVIMSKSSYDYDSPIKLVSPDTITFRRTFYLRPRLSASVVRVKS
ncbi:TadE/TadG family type IV pilus assembly protein [Caulobacter sp. DWR2-3-1b2]|uniref:TadE/TadG family type IV pilus assembly protein n=1 Tax=unclassified Caulobacter TaxID=2648921 RepID=UPI00198BA1C6|nr:pilus assembly protein [Caulobacter sp.]